MTRPPGGRSDRPGIEAHQVRIAVDEVDRPGGIPTTAIWRTIFDLAAAHPRRQVERAFHEAEVRRLTAAVSLPALLERYPGRPGAPLIRQLIAPSEPAGITRSELEERFLFLIDDHGLPRPRLNAALQLRGQFFEVDCLWERQRLAVELDGAAFHHTRSAFHRDRRRDRVLLAEGYRVLRVTWPQVRDEPEAIVADLRRLLGPASTL